MTLATLEADGASPPSQARFARVCKRLAVTHWRETLAALQVGGAAVLALAVVLTPHEVQAPPPATSVSASITPEALIGSKPGPADTAEAKQTLQALMTKAGLRPDFGLRHLTWDQARKLNALMPDVHAPSEAAQPFAISLATGNGREALTCLTQTAYYEAAANGPDAEAAVVQVVLNRVRHPSFPKSVCGVVYQGSERDIGCQFTFTCDGAMTRPVDKTAWDGARKVAARALGGYVVKAVGASTYYHADYVFPAWAPTLQKIATVGPHIFYRMAGSEGALLTGHYAGGELKLAKAILMATDRFTQKPARDTSETAPSASVLTATAAAPAGLKTQADRLQRVHEVIAAARSTEQKVETASAQAQIASPDAPIATTPAASAQTPSA